MYTVQNKKKEIRKRRGLHNSVNQLLWANLDPFKLEGNPNSTLQFSWQFCFKLLVS